MFDTSPTLTAPDYLAPAASLSPDDFPDPPGETEPIQALDAQYSAQDLATLNAALAKLRVIKTMMSSGDPQDKFGARVQMQVLIGYLAGFFDVKKTNVEQPIPRTTCLDGIFGDYGRPTLEEYLGRLEIALAMVVSGGESPTRRSAAMIQIGDILIGIGTSLVAAGIAALFLP